MKDYRIGRSRKSDIVLNDGSVSRRHAELVKAKDGRLYLIDCASSNRTFVRRQLRVGEKDRWVEIRQEFIRPDEPLRLGNVETTARELLSKLKPEPPGGQPGKDQNNRGGGGDGGDSKPRMPGPGAVLRGPDGRIIEEE